MLWQHVYLTFISIFVDFTVNPSILTTCTLQHIFHKHFMPCFSLLLAAIVHIRLKEVLFLSLGWMVHFSYGVVSIIYTSMATHSSVLAWRIPGTGEPGGLLSMGSHRVRHDWSDIAAVAAVGTLRDYLILTKLGRDCTNQSNDGLTYTEKLPVKLTGYSYWLKYLY